MKTTLSNLFDYQRFQNNPRLAAIIADTESRYDGALSDDDLSLVSAAGELRPVMPSDKSSDGTEEDPL